VTVKQLEDIKLRRKMSAFTAIYAIILRYCYPFRMDYEGENGTKWGRARRNLTLNEHVLSLLAQNEACMQSAELFYNFFSKRANRENQVMPLSPSFGGGNQR